MVIERQLWFTLPIKMDRSFQDMSIPIIVKTFGLIVFPILSKSGFETVFLRPAPTQLPSGGNLVPSFKIQTRYNF
ncbi:hypothetical protein OUZ56_026071 [Daphnia magna]|uniref:Uncharacterized protein n=1 Tax=Daphnia magna TaxID=35525 RepID=A0ABQ9ZKS7_9CRUS|nr:hypothetical protein OUZ56_026071 [Daphnia magna]